MIIDNKQNSGPAYKHPWFWFLMTPLIVVFIVGFTMLYLSIVSNDGVIVDNFYKDGLAIKTREQQDLNARELNLKGNLTLEHTLANLTLTGNIQNEHYKLWLHFIHPTQESQDIRVPLQKSGNLYTGALPYVINGRYSIMISPDLPPSDVKMWRLHADTMLPLDTHLELMPN